MEPIPIERHHHPPDPPGRRDVDSSSRILALAGTSPRKRQFEIGWERRGELDLLSRDRVPESQATGVKELALQPEITCDSIDRVTSHRKVDRRQMHANLVRAAGLEPYAEPVAHAARSG